MTNPQASATAVWTMSSRWRRAQASIVPNATGYGAVGGFDRRAVDSTGQRNTGLQAIVSLPFGALSMTRSRSIRMTRSDVLGGTDVLLWLGPDKRATSLTEYQFRMSSGEIDWRLIRAASDGNRVSQGQQQDLTQQAARTRDRLLAVQNILHMPNEPMVLADGTRNLFSISLYTLLTGPKNALNLHGIFSTEGIRETHEGRSPRSFTYEFTFLCLQQEPDYEEALDQLATVTEPPTSG